MDESLKAGDRVRVKPGMDRDRGVMILRERREDRLWVCDGDRGARWIYSDASLVRCDP